MTILTVEEKDEVAALVGEFMDQAIEPGVRYENQQDFLNHFEAKLIENGILLKPLKSKSSILSQWRSGRTQFPMRYTESFADVCKLTKSQTGALYRAQMERYTPGLLNQISPLIKKGYM